MSVSQKTVKILWSAAAGRCSFLGCREQLVFVGGAHDGKFVIGEMAHIKGERPGSNRYDASQSDQDRNEYDNLILLCPTHHTQIDKPENEAKYSVQWLLEQKSQHEAEMLRVLSIAQTSSSQYDIITEILHYLEENKQAWLNFGPFSELARRNPNDPAAHSAWKRERLATIVPNNRKIIKILNEYKAHDYEAIAKFKTHCRSYEEWVYGSANYSQVVRFPIMFETWVKEEANARRKRQFSLAKLLRRIFIF